MTCCPLGLQGGGGGDLMADTDASLSGCQSLHDGISTNGGSTRIHIVPEHAKDTVMTDVIPCMEQYKISNAGPLPIRPSKYLNDTSKMSQLKQAMMRPFCNPHNGPLRNEPGRSKRLFHSKRLLAPAQSPTSSRQPPSSYYRCPTCPPKHHCHGRLTSIHSRTPCPIHGPDAVFGKIPTITLTDEAGLTTVWTRRPASAYKRPEPPTGEDSIRKRTKGAQSSEQ
ncbi:hypothetical protein LZ30DRAFT_338409 [Colletotrichum cereale]|nr:hypothetical protein LZ30DRAFT_338409 [Colletotrichum cereale]